MNEFSSYVHLNDFYKERHEAEGELRKLNEEFLIEQSMIFKNTSLLNDCKPTREFLTMEQKRAGYCAISKLKVSKEDKNTGKKINIEVTEPQEIREEMRCFYQNIFAKQQIIEGPSAIENFLNSDDDYRPLLELKKRTLSNSQRDALEGEITLQILASSKSCG